MFFRILLFQQLQFFVQVLQKYLNFFQTNTDCIKLASFKDYDVQTLLKESELLITDFSSVFFDFAYMRKPILYFHFDEDEFYGKHYDRGYFDYNEMGFGEICLSIDQVVEKIIYKIKDRMHVEAVYKKRMEAFFQLYDNKNCERIFEVVSSK